MYMIINQYSEAATANVYNAGLFTQHIFEEQSTQSCHKKMMIKVKIMMNKGTAI